MSTSPEVATYIILPINGQTGSSPFLVQFGASNTDISAAVKLRR